MAISMAMSDTDKFMDKFDPVNSNREKRKKMRLNHGGGPDAGGGRGGSKRDKKAGALFDDKGMLLYNGADVCDCLNEDCPGCYFPCPKCRSPKCSFECRANRKWVFETIEVEGTDVNQVNKLLPPKT